MMKEITAKMNLDFAKFTACEIFQAHNISQMKTMLQKVSGSQSKTPEVALKCLFFQGTVI